MTVADLIAKLQEMPQDAQVDVSYGLFNENDAPDPITNVSNVHVRYADGSERDYVTLG